MPIAQAKGNLICSACGQVIWDKPLYISDSVYCGHCNPDDVVKYLEEKAKDETARRAERV